MISCIRVALGASAALLAGCGSVVAPDLTPSDPVGGLGSNGLPNAAGDEVMADAEMEDIRIVLVRATADYDSDFLGIRVSEDSVQFAEGYFSGGMRNKVITLDGVPINFVDGIATSGGQTFERFTYVDGDAAQVEGIYTYDGNGKSGKDVEALYLIGFETPPDVLSARSDTPVYLGRFTGFGHVANGQRAVIGSEIFAGGDIAIMADFTEGTASGSLTGQVEFGDGIQLEGTFENADLTDGGFASALTMPCPEGSTCTSASSLGGVFFDANGGEVAGLIGFDETQSEGPGNASSLRFVGVAGFAALEEPVVE